ncbi:MAG: GtrA family protein [Candidatus Heimdallarchaeaceae archaeon]
MINKMNEMENDPEKEKKSLSPQIKRRFTRFAIVSIGGLAINELIIFVMLKILNQITEKDLLFTIGKIRIEKIIISTFIAIIIVTIYNFILNKIWTFKEKEEGIEVNVLKQFIKFSIVGASGTVVNLGIVYLLATVLSINDFIATSIAFILSVINNYVFNEIWTFNVKKSKE